jgi:putative membrane protein
MKFLRSLITILILIATLAVGVLFALQNKAPVSLDLLIYTFDPKSLALWVLLSLAVGGVLGMLISSGIVLRLRASLHSSNRKLRKAQTELDSLRTAGLKDSE